MRLEKEKKNGKQSETSVEKKRKQPSDNNTEGQKKEKKLKKQTNDKENEQKAKDREEKKKKKEEDKQRQNFLLETRKSQAAARWASTNDSPPRSDNHTESELTIVADVHSIPGAGFTPLPLRSRNSNVHVTPSRTDQLGTGITSLTEQQEEPALTVTGSTPISQHTLPKTDSSIHVPSTKGKKGTSLPNNPHSATARNRGSPPLSDTSTESPQSQHGRTNSNQDETPRRQHNKENKNCDPRRGLHFQSSQVESSSEDEDDSNHCVPDDPEVAHGNCCREQQLENKALRNRIQKLHRRLNIACKSNSFTCTVCIF